MILRLKLTVSTYRMNEINFASSFMDAMNALCYVLKNFTFNVIYILLTCHWLVSRMRVVIEAWNVLHVHYTRSLLLFRLRENRSTGNTNWHRTFFSKWEIISFLGQESETFIRISRGFETQNKRGLKMVAFFQVKAKRIPFKCYQNQKLVWQSIFNMSVAGKVLNLSETGDLHASSAEHKNNMCSWCELTRINNSWFDQVFLYHCRSVFYARRRFFA